MSTPSKLPLLATELRYAAVTLSRPGDTRLGAVCMHAADRIEQLQDALREIAGRCRDDDALAELEQIATRALEGLR